MHQASSQQSTEHLLSSEGLCIGCGTTVNAPVMRCYRCVLKASATTNRPRAITEYLLNCGPVEKEHFSFSLQTLFGMTTLIAVLLGACVADLLFGLVLGIILLPATIRSHRMLRIAEALEFKLLFQWKMWILFSTTVVNFVVTALRIGIAFTLFMASTLGLALVLNFAIDNITSYSSPYDVFYVMANMLLAILCPLALILIIFLAIAVRRRVVLFNIWRWQHDLYRIAQFANLESSNRYLEQTSPFDNF